VFVVVGVIGASTAARAGVVGLDPRFRVTLVNDEAMRLLDLPAGSVGRTLEDLGVDRRLYEVLSGRTEGQDQIVLLGERVLTLSRMPVASRGRDIGSVTTLRDRTELVSPQRELDVTRTTTDSLRAQTREFSDQLHTISGLIELEEHHEVVRHVSRLTRSQARLNDRVTSLVEDLLRAASADLWRPSAPLPLGRLLSLGGGRVQLGP
jgi:two-component system, CitB family, sensor kinase